MSTQVTYETYHISVLYHLRTLSTMSSALIFVYYEFYRDLKEKYDIRRNISCKKRKVSL